MRPSRWNPWRQLMANHQAAIAIGVLAAVVALLGAWALASPIGSSPDDDFHLVSAWCAPTSGGPCAQTGDDETRLAPAALVSVACFAFNPEESADCQGDSLEVTATADTQTARGNFDGTYPPLFYAANGLLASGDLEASALTMRLVNLTLFVVLAAATSLALPLPQRRAAHLAWLITAVPLTVYLVPSNNPSGWTLTGIAVLIPALWAAVEADGKRRLLLHALAALGALAACGSRADGALYAACAAVGVLIARQVRLERRHLTSLVLVAGIVLAAGTVLATTSQAEDAADGLGEGASSAPGGLGLLGWNLLRLPALWAGGFGGTGLGWLDTEMPPVVLWGTASVFIAIVFAALRSLDRPTLVVCAGTAAALVVIPLAVLQRSGDVVGANVQPRYLWPLVMALALFVLLGAANRRVELGRLQSSLAWVGLVAANTAALYSTMRRFITGTDGRSIGLSTGAEWWWPTPVPPEVVLIVGAAAFAVLAAWVLFSGRDEPAHGLAAQ